MLPQVSFDYLFHQPGDTYPSGSEAHQELCEFIPKLASFRARQAATQAAESTDAPDSQQAADAAAAAERLGLPAKYDPRYRVNASIVSEEMQGVRSSYTHHTTSQPSISTRNKS